MVRLVQRPEVASIMVDMMRTMIDELSFVRPYTLVSELFVTDSYEQVCPTLLGMI